LDLYNSVRLCAGRPRPANLRSCHTEATSPEPALRRVWSTRTNTPAPAGDRSHGVAQRADHRTQRRIVHAERIPLTPPVVGFASEAPVVGAGLSCHIDRPGRSAPRDLLFNGERPPPMAELVHVDAALSPEPCRTVATLPGLVGRPASDLSPRDVLRSLESWLVMPPSV